MAEIHYEDFLKKREIKERWIQYWATLEGKKIYLYVSRECQAVDFCEVILLSSCSRCILLKRRTYSFRFRLTTSEGHFYFKCDSNLQRHRWIHMIHLASSGRSPESPPNHINMRCCYRKEKPEMDLAKRSSSTEKIVKEGESTVEVLDKKDTRNKDEASTRTSPSLEHGQSKHSERGYNIDRSRCGSESSKESSEQKLEEDTNHVAETEHEKKQANSMTDISNGKIRHAKDITSASKQTWTFRALGSFRKSSRRQSLPPKENNNLPEDASSTTNSQLKLEDEVSVQFARYSMENPAFTDDDLEGMQKEEKAFFQAGRIINIIPCNK